MSNPFNKDIVVDLVKNFVDCNRCLICDKFDGPRWRYTCGHTACEDCIKTGCSLCLTPPNASTFHEPLLDNPLSRRISNASKLLKACQDSFKVDVFKRHRVSEQLKIEKDLFPKCIQAPVKYFNKRKSLNVSDKNKENRYSCLPGEQISPLKNNKMENFNYVQQWLDGNDKSKIENKHRKPFSDLKVNNQSLHRKQTTPIKKRVDLILDNVHNNCENVTKRETSRKRTHFKSTHSIVDSQSLLDHYLKPVEKKKPLQYTPKKFKPEADTKTSNVLVQNVLNKSDKDESGIVIDDEPIVIDDSQSQIIDKDKLAWLAVLKAAENETVHSTTSERLECSLIKKYSKAEEKILPKPIRYEIENDKSGFYKVPFFKMGFLSEACKSCKGGDKNELNIKGPSSKFKDVSITIESKSFTTIITMSNSIQSHSKGLTQSVPVQTDIQGVDQIKEDLVESQGAIEQKHSNDLLGDNKNHQIKTNVYNSQDLFTAEAKEFPENMFDKAIAKESKRELHNENSGTKEAKNIVIADSDSDDDVNLSSTIQVTADVHRSSDQFDCDILTEIDQSEIRKRSKREGRGITPTSTNSSDKENYDPNRAKRIKHCKKGVGKKNKKKHDVISFIV